LWPSTGDFFPKQWVTSRFRLQNCSSLLISCSTVASFSNLLSQASKLTSKAVGQRGPLAVWIPFLAIVFIWRALIVIVVVIRGKEVLLHFNVLRRALTRAEQERTSHVCLSGKGEGEGRGRTTPLPHVKRRQGRKEEVLPHLDFRGKERRSHGSDCEEKTFFLDTSCNDQSLDLDFLLVQFRHLTGHKKNSRPPSRGQYRP